MNSPAFYILIGFISISFVPNSVVKCVIRNDITDRCIHLQYMNSNPNAEKRLEDEDKIIVSVVAKPCSWDTKPNVKRKSNPDQWLEIIPTSPEANTKQTYSIKKVANHDTDVCLAFTKDDPFITTSCFSSEATFTIDRVYQGNFKGSVTSLTSFKIRNGFGKCLTVLPGKEILKFKECSSRAGLFQVWSVCRHSKKCDAGLTWTPREIEFPFNETSKANASSSNEANLSNFTNKPAHATQGILNEVLYTVQNAIRIFDSSDYFITETIGAFYSLESLNQAVLEVTNICIGERFACPLCESPPKLHASSSLLTNWLLGWMNQCNTSPTRDFLSSNVLHVPLHLFPSHEPSYLRKVPFENKKQKMMISSLKAYLHKLEDQVEENETEVTHKATSTTQIQEPVGNFTVEDNEDAITFETGILDSNKNKQHGRQPFSEVLDLNANITLNEDILGLLDVRLGVTKNSTFRSH